LGSLYCCSDGVRGRGAPVTNLAHTGFLSFHRKDHTSKPWDQTPSFCRGAGELGWLFDHRVSSIPAGTIKRPTWRRRGEPGTCAFRCASIRKSRSLLLRRLTVTLR
jgi:hypothetical protein